MAKTAPIPPSQRELAPDLEEVLMDHEDRLARFRVDREDPVVSEEEADLMLTTLIVTVHCAKRSLGGGEG